VQAAAAVALAAATLVLCIFTKNLYNATKDLTRVAIDPQVEVKSPLLLVATESAAELKIDNIGACELLSTQVQLEAVLTIGIQGATIPRVIPQDLRVHQIGFFKPGEGKTISYWNEAKEVLRIQSNFEPLQGQQLISCDLHCYVVGQHPVSKVVYVHESIYKVTSSKTADIMLSDITPKTAEPTFRRISRSRRY
jgi:hypothetical protein